MNRYDSKSSVIWFLVASAIIVWSSTTLKFGTFRHPGPAFLPTLCGVIILGLATIVFFQSKRKKKEISGERLLEKRSLFNILPTIGILIIYAFILERFGFILTTLVVMFFIFKQIARGTWFGSILESSIVTGACYLIFGYMLKISLPKGWLGI